MWRLSSARCRNASLHRRSTGRTPPALRLSRGGPEHGLTQADGKGRQEESIKKQAGLVYNLFFVVCVHEATLAWQRS